MIENRIKYKDQIEIKDNLVFNKDIYLLLSVFDYYENDYIPRMITDSEEDIFRVANDKFERDNFKKYLKDDEEYTKYFDSIKDKVANGIKSKQKNLLDEVNYVKIEEITRNDIKKYIFKVEEYYNNKFEIKYTNDNKLLLVKNEELDQKEYILNSIIGFNILKTSELYDGPIKSIEPVVDYIHDLLECEIELEIPDISEEFFEDLYKSKEYHISSELTIESILDKVKKYCPHHLDRVKQRIILDILTGNLTNINYDNYICEYKNDIQDKFESAATILDNIVDEAKDKIIEVENVVKKETNLLDKVKLDKNKDGLVDLNDIKILKRRNFTSNKIKYRLREYNDLFNMFNLKDDIINTQKSLINYIYSLENQSFSFFNKTSTNILSNWGKIEDITDKYSLLLDKNELEIINKKVDNLKEICEYTDNLITKHNNGLRKESEELEKEKRKQKKQKMSNIIFKISSTLEDVGDTLEGNKSKEDNTKDRILSVNTLLTDKENNTITLTNGVENIECEKMEVIELNSIKINEVPLDLKSDEVYHIKPGDKVDMSYKNGNEAPLECNSDIYVRLNDKGNYEFLIPKNEDEGSTEEVKEKPEESNNELELEYYETGIPKNPYHE